jgi:glycosyltransferase involved in cell wall biosynthesis
VISIPVIPPIPADGNPRPFWSVMIPAYNARPDYLEETLRSILAQAPDPQQMQIEVVDDCSPDGGPMESVRLVAGDRVKVHREPKNLGLAKIWNRCIERAQGEWVHILHQDDVVMPGFYDALRKGIESDPGVGAAFVRHVTINPNGHWMAICRPASGNCPSVDCIKDRIIKCLIVLVE